jgi:serine/threonine protein kinase
VFRAVQTRLSRTVAIKVLLVDGDATTHAQYQRELETTVLLSSQAHIVGIIDTGTTQAGNPYIVMEYCPGGSYAQILKQRGPLPVDEVVDVGTKIAEALQAAHDVGVLHRDVKPSNILRSAFGPALADFGIARAPHQLHGTVSMDRMTPHHASPEAMRKGNQSPASDLYSLASTMWHLLAGRPPFSDPARPITDLDELRQRVLSEPAPAVPRPDVPDWLQRELARALAKEPGQRHPSAHTFAEILRYHAYRARDEMSAWPSPSPDPQPVPVPPTSAPPFSPPFSAPPSSAPPSSAPPSSGPPAPAPSSAPPASGPPGPPQSMPSSGWPAGPGAAPRSAFRWPQAAPTRRSQFSVEPDRPVLDPDALEAAAAATITWSGRPPEETRPADAGTPGDAGTREDRPPAETDPAFPGPIAPGSPAAPESPAVPARSAAGPEALTRPTDFQPAIREPEPQSVQPQPFQQPERPAVQPPERTAFRPPERPASRPPAPPVQPPAPITEPATQPPAPPPAPSGEPETQPLASPRWPDSATPATPSWASHPPAAATQWPAVSAAPTSAPPAPTSGPPAPVFPPPASGPGGYSRPPVTPQSPGPPQGYPPSTQQVSPPPGYPAYQQLPSAPPARPVREQIFRPDRAPGGSSRRNWLIIGAAAVAVLIIVVVVGVIVNQGGNKPGPTANGPISASPTPGGTGTLQPTATGAPTNVQLVDKHTSITLTWTDPTAGTVSFAVLGGVRGAEPRLQKYLSPGTTTLTVQGLNTADDYCYIVMAIYSTQTYARAPQVCTKRF